MKKLIIIVLSVIYTTQIYAQQYGSFTDSRDGKIYKTVKIGRQVWMAENLSIDKISNEEEFSEIKTAKEWKEANENGKPAWCYYNFDKSNTTKLYNWYAVHADLAPPGWHLPSEDEWEQLIKFLGGKYIAGGKLKSKTGWKNNGNGTNSVGFSGIPSGWCNYLGKFNDISKYGSWWSTWEYGGDNAWIHIISKFDNEIGNITVDKGYGLAVRCIKD
jgi:uncharacterized protein (TIGR02145 family)